MSENLLDYLKVVEKIPFLRGLSLNQVRQVMHTGKVVKCPTGRTLCKDGDKSTEMFILLAGELAVRDGDMELARVRPVEIVGEMGLITSQPRCATLHATENTILIVIEKMPFEALLRTDIDMAVKIYKNLIDSLCNKLRENNARLKKNQLTAAYSHITATVV